MHNKKPVSPNNMAPLACSALTMFLAVPVVVNAATITIDTPTFGIATINSGDSLHVTPSGAITVIGPSAAAVETYNGAISLTNDGTIYGSSYGAVVHGTMTGTITNSGTLSGNNDGIFVDSGDISGGISNSGTISANNGIAVFSGDISGGIGNSGTISGNNNGIVVYNSSDISGGISNSGTISGNNNGIYIENGSDISGGITNNGGVIGASAYGATATALAVNAGAMSGNITNSGTIDATATATNLADAAGVFINTLTGNLTNSGTGTISASAYAAPVAYATGVYIGDMSGGNLTNGGDIQASADGSSSAFAQGIFIEGTLTGDITNSGDITATATASSANAVGIYVANVSSGTLTNAGTITANAPGTYGFIYGIKIDNLGGGTISNSGTITTNNNFLDGSSAAISVGNGGTYTITNSGTINANDGAGEAIRAYGAAVTINQNAGTLNGSIYVGGGNTTINLNGGTITGGISDNNGSTDSDTLNINTSFTLGGDISGIEQINVNSGTTDLNGHYMSGNNMSVATGATAIFRGGAVAADVTNNGTVELASGSTAISGINGYHGESGTTQVDITSSVSAGAMEVSGTAYIGAVQVNVNTSDYLGAGTPYDVVTAASLNTTAMTISDNSYVLDFNATNSGTVLTLTADRVATYQSAASGFGLAGQLDAIAAGGSPTPEQAALMGQLDSAPSASVLAQRVADMSPDSTGAALGGSREVAGQVSDMVGQRIDNQLASAGQSGMAAGDAFRNSGVWLQGFSGNSTQDGSLGNNGYDGKNQGFVLGADTAVSSNARVGLSLASSKNNLDVASGVVGDTLVIKSTHVTLYGSYDAGSWNVAGMVASSKHDYDSVRNATNTASYSGSQLGMMVEGGYPMAMAGIKVMPVVSFSHSTLDLDGYSESGPSALTVGSSSYTSNELGLGAKVSKEIPKGNLTWVPRGSLRYKHESGDVNQETNATLAGISFATEGLKRKRGTMELGVGVDLLSGDNLAVQADYQLDSRSDYKANTFRLKVRYNF